MISRRSFLSQVTTLTAMYSSAFFATSLDAKWHTYLFVNTSEEVLPRKARKHFLNFLKEEKTNDHWLPNDLKITIYFSKNKNHEPLAKNIAANLNSQGIPTHVEAINEEIFQRSWKKMNGVFLMDCAPLPGHFNDIAMRVT